MTRRNPDAQELQRRRADGSADLFGIVVELAEIDGVVGAERQCIARTPRTKTRAQLRGVLSLSVDQDSLRPSRTHLLPSSLT